MKVSYKWLQKYFDEPLPSVEELSDAITFHAFEIDGVEDINGDQVLDVKVLPDRSHDCLSHRGIAKEIAVILDRKLSSDPLQLKPILEPITDTVVISIENPELCNRYIAGVMKGVKVGPSPEWLKERLEAIGQRSINNIVDATNFVMFNSGQPLHAFDASKIKEENGKRSIRVRYAREGEKMIALDQKEYALTETMLVISDHLKDEAIGIAGVKGGVPASITQETTDIIIESANFNGASVRRTSASLKLRTDASVRYENVISPDLALYGMGSVVDMIQNLAGGEIVGFVDEYPKPQATLHVGASASDVNRICGTSITDADMEAILKRFNFETIKEGDRYSIEVPFERLDLRITEDLVADISRIYGYDLIPSVPPPQLPTLPEVNKRFYYIDRIRGWLTANGFSEVYTSVFTVAGKRAVLNKVASDTPYLRCDIWPSLQEALEMNFKNRDLLGLEDTRLFEIGTVWGDKGEQILLAVGTFGNKNTPMGSEFLSGLIKEFDLNVPSDIPKTPIIQIDLDSLIAHAPDPLSYQDLPTLGDVRYKPFSRQPFAVRDVAFWAPEESDALSIQEAIKKEAGEYCISVRLFDRFQKEDRISLAYRLVFQAMDRTLTEEDINGAMERVYVLLKAKGYEIR